jgi:plastocyanin
MASIFSLSALAALSVPLAYATTWEVSVGKGGLVFDPPFVQGAQVGDVVNFTFNPKKHS